MSVHLRVYAELNDFVKPDQRVLAPVPLILAALRAEEMT